MLQHDPTITTAVAIHPDFGTMRFEPQRQDRRTYYRLTVNGRSGGALTDAKHALLTIDYWRRRGWLQTT